MAEWVRECQFLTTFTGAGLSTACGIPDYRSGYGTVLPTGPGCWEKAAMKEKFKMTVEYQRLTPAEKKLVVRLIEA